METEVHQDKSLPSQGLKQVKVDNWGIFFLQRLQQLYAEEQLLDLKIKFPTSNIIVQAHRLVLTTCTDYFMQLEQQQKGNEDFDGIITMPSDMPYECVKSIISFMYTGQLEYWTLEQQSLYRTAQKMNMAVLTKLLDAQFNTSSPHTDVAKPPVQPAVSKPSISASKPLASSISSTSTLPEQPLPGKKLPIWKRKLDDTPSVNYEAKSFGTLIHKPEEITPGPSRFDLPEADDIALGIFSSFDDITYDTKPIVQASDKYKKENSSGKRSLEDDNKNDTTEDEEEESQGNEKSPRDANSDDDWSISKNFRRSQDEQPKKVRFDLEEKENVEKSKSNQQQSTEDSISNHAKIIKEVLKKYPHLVKNKNNIRLKIMQKEAKSSDSNGKTKVSYVVLKSDHLLSNNDDNDSKCNGNIDGEKGPWKCNKCDLDEEYTNYYMYRRHMQDVHEEKFDPRVCEHCGYKASKRNLLMYHLYTKHNVPPPKSMHFPKCHACSYVALSENLLVRHQINYKHRPASRQHPFPSEEIQCSQCNESFRSITELTTHELNSGHGNATDGKETKGHRCPYCGKHFVRLTNLQIHLDCVHKELQRDTAMESASPVPSIPLEPSSEAEALSHVVSGIAASLGVEVEESAPETQDRITTVKSTDQYVVPDMEIEMMDNTCSYNEVEGQHMIMLVDTDGKYRQTENEHHQQPQQLDIADNEQIVMQGTDDGMIVYIHGAEQTDHRSYENYQSAQVAQEAEEVVEEVVEEVEEELIEEEEEEEEVVQKVQQNTMMDDSADNQVQEVIQYVEEQTEIVEYDEEQCIDHSSIDENQESVMIIEEEHVEDVEETDN